MPKTLTTMRRHPATSVLAILLFLATLALTSVSLGIVRPGEGGDNDDGGSGFGGTGRSGDFGGSGLGGTGMPSPFITDTSEPVEQPQTPAQSPSEELPAEDLLPELIIEPMIAETPQSPELPQRQQASAEDMSAAAEVMEMTIEVVEPVIEAVLPTPIQIVETPQLDTDPTQQLAEEPAEEQKEAVAPQLAETQSENLHEGDNELDRSSLPERIQRPELPPVQRIRPVDRPAIAAPPALMPARTF